MILRQSTAVDVLIGPFVDLTDGATAEPGESPSVKLSKNGQTLAAKNDVTTPVHDADGYYNCELDATDTNTVGILVLTVAASANALPVRHEFQVVEEATYDFLSAAGATPIADINAEVDTAIGDASLATAAALATVDGNVDAILVDTAEIGTAGAGLTEAGGTGDQLTALVPAKNVALSDIEFLMVDGTDHVTPKTGLTVTGQRSIDGGAFASATGTIAEVSNGIYQIDASQADMNGSIITFRFSASGADDTFLTIKTTG